MSSLVIPETLPGVEYLGLVSIRQFAYRGKPLEPSLIVAEDG